MEQVITNDPRAGFIILIILTLADLVFRGKTNNLSLRPKSEFYQYESATARETGTAAYFALVFLKISPPFLIALIWAVAQASGSKMVAELYGLILGFSMSLYLIINLRHIESILIDRLVRRYRDDLSGKLIIRRRFSLGQSAIQILTLFVLLTIIAVLNPSPLHIGFAAAPLALIVRNTLLIRL